MMIDQLIKKYLQEYIQKNSISLINEVIQTNSKSGWTIEILDYKSIKNQRANNKAQSAGAQSGMIIIATKARKAKTNDGLLETDIRDLLEANDVRSTGYPFNPATHLFVLMQVKNKPYRKIWNLWAIDKRTSGINDTSKEIKTALQKSKYYTSTSLNIDRLQGIPLMNYAQTENWFKYLTKQHADLKLKTKLKLPKLESMKDDVSVDSSNISSQIVTITTNEKDANLRDITSIDNKLITTIPYADSNGFIGKAAMSVSADGQSLTFEPIEGVQSIQEKISGRTGTFEGTFKNGAPSEGEAIYDEGISDDDVIVFNGKLDSTIETKITGTQTFSFKFKSGTAEYKNGFLYKGTWKQGKEYNKTAFDTGELYNKENKLVRSYTDGEYKQIQSDLELQPTETENTETIPAVITYPFEWNTTSGKWTIYNEGNKVYYFNKKSTWTSIDKQEFENKVVSGETITFVPIVDEAEQTRLDGLFSKTHRATNTTPVRPTSKKKYIVIKNNVTEVNLYTLENNKFKFYIKLPPERSDKTTGNRLVDTKQLPIQGGNDTRYKMYNFKSGGSSIWIPERFVTIVER
jgi:hypothetical protein